MLSSREECPILSTQGKTKKCEALRQAQLTTMKEFPEPFYWAAYQLTGEP
jgi:CHAT domain-containing protein